MVGWEKSITWKLHSQMLHVTNPSQPTTWSKLQRNIKLFFDRASPLPNTRHWYIRQETTTPRTECDHNRTTWAPPQNCTYSSIQVPTTERKHKRKQLVLVTQDTKPVHSLESAAPHQNSLKNTKAKEARSYETHSTKPQGPRAAEKEGRREESIAMSMRNALPKDWFILYQTLGRRLLEPAVGIRAVLRVS